MLNNINLNINIKVICANALLTKRYFISTLFLWVVVPTDDLVILYTICINELIAHSRHIVVADNSQFFIGRGKVRSCVWTSVQGNFFSSGAKITLLQILMKIRGVRVSMGIYKYPSKNYLHFDHKIHYTKKVESYVEGFAKNPVHSFLPFIFGEMDVSKYQSLEDDMGNTNLIRNGKKVPIKPKKRPIMYASHIDNFIYKHYGVELNELYNDYVLQNKFNHSVTAYRNNKKGKSNIHFAAEVINFIAKSPDCYIYIGDYEAFFDTLNHAYLKAMINRLYKNSRMPDHQYKIYKNITKFAYVKKEDINSRVGSDKKLRKNREFKYFSNSKEFRKFKNSNGILNINENDYGIPQGTAISAVYSNIYLMEMDRFLTTSIENKRGLYRRYSDDFIIILPNITEKNFIRTIKNIEEKIESKTKLTLHLDKTNQLKYDTGELLNIETGGKNSLDYLGFVFDGSSVRMREKSVYKFYRNAYKLIKKGKQVSIKKGHVGKEARLTYKRELYSKYHQAGFLTDRKYKYKPRQHGTFLNYAIKSQSIFDRLSPHTDNLMMDQVKNHQIKLSKKVGNALNELRNKEV